MNYRSFFATPLFKGSLRAHLILIVLVAIVPVLLFSGVMLGIFARQEKETVKAGLRETNRALVSALELEFESTLSTLLVLASSAALDSRDLEGFHRILARALPTRADWKTITLHDPSGKELIDLLGLPETEEPEPARKDSAIQESSFKELLRTQRPVPVEYHVAPRIGPLVGVRVPVLRGGKVRYVLTAGIDPIVFRNILARQNLPEGSVGIVFDRQRTIVAASRQDLVGRPVGSLLTADGGPKPTEGWVEGVNWAGIASFATFEKSPTSGWSVALLVPSQNVRATLRQSLFAVAGAGVLFLVGGLLLAIVIEERISPPLKNLTTAANALGRGEPVSFVGASPVTEIGALAQDLQRAASLLRERAQERDRAEGEIRQINQDLERLVVEQTRELATANRVLESNIAELRDEVRERHRIEEALRREHHHLELLQKTELATNQAATLEEIVRLAVEHICIHLKWHLGHAVYLAQGAPQQTPRPGFWYFKVPDQRFEPLRRVIDDLSGEGTLASRVAASRTVEVIADLGQERASHAWARVALDAGLVSAVGFPVMAGNQVVAALEFFCDHFVVFDDRLAGIIARIADQLGRTVERKQAEEALRLSEERFRKTFEEGPIGITLADSNCRYFRVNRAFVEMLGCPERDLLRQDCFARVHPRDVAKMRDLTGRLLRGEIDNFRQEGRYLNTRGEPVWTHVTATMITSSDGSQKYALQMVENITEQTRIEEKLRESERLAVLGATTAMFAHEIGNPLNSISTTVQLLERDLERPKPSDRELMLTSLRDIRQEITRLGALLHEFRFLSRPHNLNLQPAAMDRLARELIEGESERYAQRGVKVQAAFPPELPAVLADEQRLKQALWNVCENAVDAMPNGGKLTLRGYSYGDDVCLDIQDTGIGIPEGLDVFELFTTTKANGTGLGLAIVRQILAAHGGSIRYETKPGEGTVFVVALPQALKITEHEMSS
jgi:PAS domain S-box-containing protein